MAMNRTEILATVGQLAQSQGFYSRMYGRMLRIMDEDPEAYDRAMTELEAMKFSDAVDLVMYFET